MKYAYQPPLLVQKLFSKFIWNSKQNKILLTFDDGPNPATTEKILKTLRKENIPALFFCVGNNVSLYPKLVKEIVDENHSVGNHTFNHKVITKLTSEELRKEITSTNEIIGEVIGTTPKWFRPPHGRFPFRLAGTLKEYSMTNVMWTLLPYDYKNDAKVVKFAVKNYLTENSIVVLHDSNKSSAIICDSIKYIADEARSNNFQFGTAEECLK